MTRCVAERACLALPHLRGTGRHRGWSAHLVSSAIESNLDEKVGGKGQTSFGLIDAEGTLCLESRTSRPMVT